MTDNQKKFWDELKAKHPEALLLFRCGDFYETYNEDAVACAAILGITLTMNKDDGSMAGFPHHALDSYLPKLVRAGKRVAICDWPTEPPKKKRGITETIETSETKSEETMAKTMTAQDYVGKTVSIKGSDAKYVIKSVDGDKLMTDFYRAKDAQPMPCPLPWATLEAKLKEGVYIVEGATDTATDEVEEVDDIKVEGPKTAETIDMKPKQEKSDKPKAKGGSRGQAPDSPQATHQGASPHDAAGLRYETYTTKKGKTGAKIVGFRETDAAYLAGPELHGGKWQETDKQGNKTYCLLFSHRYAKAAKEVCEALNAGKALKDCQAIVDKATEERARQRDEWKQKREERKAQSNEQEQPKGKTYTEAEVADLLKRVIAGDKEAMEIVNAMSKAA